MTDSDDEFYAILLATFREDAEELLTGITDGLIKLEQAEDHPEPFLIEEVFRKTHSLKGAARAVNLREIESVCLNLENIFSLMKREEFFASAAEFDLFHDAVKSIRNFLSDGEKKSPQPVDIIQKLRASLAERKPTEKNEEVFSVQTEEGPFFQTPSIMRQGSEEKKPVIPLNPDPAVFAAPSTFLEVKPALHSAQYGSDAYHGPPASDSGTVRIAAKKLDRLIIGSDNLLSTRLFLTHRMQELEEMISRFSLWRWNHSLVFNDMHLIRDAMYGLNRTSLPPELLLFLERVCDFLEYDREFVTNLQHDLAAHIHATDLDRSALEASTTEIADLIHDAVLVPVSSILIPISGQIRESSRGLGKEVDLKTEGGEIEMDRRLLDMLKVPMMHLINNSVDHGIEYPDEREANGKPPRGQIRIKITAHSGSKVEITLSDDGRGIDREKIKKTAIEKGLLSDEEGTAIDDDEAIWLIFKSGLTTSPMITDLSGRGLGLAIVEDTITRMGGEVLVTSEKGKGTTFSLILPIRLATLRGLVIRSGTSYYVVPVQQILQVIRVPLDQEHKKNVRQMIHYKGEMLPIIRLSEALKVLDFGTDDPSKEIPVLIVAYGAGKIAYAVDEVIQVQEIVVRPLGTQLRRVKKITGAAVLGDGKLALVLDPPELIQEGLRLSGQAPAPLPPRKTSGKVLIVEDSVTSRALLRRTLENAGFQVTTASDGMEAFSILLEEEVDIVVSDVDMPRMNGFSLTEKIRNDERLSHLPVVLVTALDSREDREHGLSSGANAYILKGTFERSELVRTVKGLLA
ncbi:CheA signal transduction histidine kinases [Methanospirillum hungatei JF-1]|uniref:histidine kinase n=1 Tax=Methanospirillum hungatei JF-1 (strain ATCC 27890 / DSM 864 / NBRC 100397 / JF-1) TaxID=323259 RepID=Q2FQ07_METHJ|nr:response regulator [Methanospirillum hungatei]ABD40256.1 CheA signal transduction histidine kinases [Methanospirillum hungatei JF-1]